MARIRYNGLRATLGGSLTNSATSVTFGAALTHSGGTAVPTLTAGDYIPLSILTSGGELSEVVYLTAYTSGATTGTISRGQEGTAGAVHASGHSVVGAPLVGDVVDPFPLTPMGPDFTFTDGYSGLSLQGYVSGDLAISGERLVVATPKSSTNYLYASVSASTDFTATMRASFQSSASGTMFGILGVNTGGSGVGTLMHTGSPDGVLCAYLQTTGAYDGIQANNLTVKGSLVGQGIPTWYRLRRSGTAMYSSVSLDGYLWTPEATLTAAAFANITRVGFGTAAGTAPTGFTVDFFDVR